MVPAQISVTIMSEDPSFLRGSNASRLIGLIDDGESARQHAESSANQSVVAACDRRDAIFTLGQWLLSLLVDFLSNKSVARRVMSPLFFCQHSARSFANAARSHARVFSGGLL